MGFLIFDFRNSFWERSLYPAVSRQSARKLPRRKNTPSRRLENVAATAQQEIRNGSRHHNAIRTAHSVQDTACQPTNARKLEALNFRGRDSECRQQLSSSLSTIFSMCKYPIAGSDGFYPRAMAISILASPGPAGYIRKPGKKTPLA